MQWVVDCSFTMAWCLPDEASENVSAFIRDCMTKKEPFLVSTFWNYETGNVLVSALKSSRLDKSQVIKILSVLSSLRCQIVSPDLQQTLEISSLAEKYKLSFYDASYLALALNSGSGLASLDAELIKVAQDVDIMVPKFLVK